jgi:hypothetical protein
MAHKNRGPIRKGDFVRLDNGTFGEIIILAINHSKIDTGKVKGRVILANGYYIDYIGEINNWPYEKRHGIVWKSIEKLEFIDNEN